MRHLLLSLLSSLVLAAPTEAQVDEAFQLGVDAYRRGRYAEAEAHWRACLERPLTDAERARVAYDLGNASWRRDDKLQAVGWYTIAVELEPRDADAWHNLELARAAAGLEPRDRGGLADTYQRVTSAFRPAEARALVWCGLALVALTLLGEALHGGRLWRRSVYASLVLGALLALPWMHGLGREEGGRLLVVRAPQVELKSEPKADLAPIAAVPAGEEVRRIDALPGWVRIAASDGLRGWLPEDALFELDPGRAPDAR